MSQPPTSCGAHEWRCPVVMKTDPDRVAYTCARCGAIAVTAGGDPAPGAPRRPSSWGDGDSATRRRSPNCLYLGDAVVVRDEGTPEFVGTVVAFDGPSLEIVTSFRPSAHAGTQIRRRVSWDRVDGR